MTMRRFFTGSTGARLVRAAGAALAALLAFGGLASATVADRSADAVLGQPDFTTVGCNRGGLAASPASLPDAASLCGPAAVVVDRVGRLWVADSGNNRVVRWPNTEAFVTHQAADLVLGQPGFTSAACNAGGINARTLCGPFGLAVEDSGALWVADSGNNRLLRYAHPRVRGQPADLVLGQPDFTHGGCNTGGVSARSLCRPLGVASDRARHLYVGDFENGRVLAYSHPRTGGRAALVLGQPDFTIPSRSRCFVEAHANAQELCQPAGVAVDNFRCLWIADRGHSRVLAFTRPRANQQPADLVLGHPDFGSGGLDGCRPGQTSATSLCFPLWVGVGARGEVYVADTADSRVLRYARPHTSGQPADLLLGQPEFAGSFCNAGRSNADRDTLCRAEGVAVDRRGDVLVADSDNSRVLRYDRSTLAEPEPGEDDDDA